MKQSKGKLVAALSGGVDSSVAAALCQQQGYELVGVTHYAVATILPKNVNHVVAQMIIFRPDWWPGC